MPMPWTVPIGWSVTGIRLTASSRRRRSTVSATTVWKASLAWRPTRKNISISWSRCLRGLIAVLKDTGSLWVNLGDTYWSGRGQARGGENKQSARRFGCRPQDKRRSSLWTRGKQLLLIPHRFAIAMQGEGWIVRNDNVWVKANPTPDQVRDRCAMSHEYMFHFVRERFYHFDKKAVGRRTQKGGIMPPYDTWQVPSSHGVNGHQAVFSEQLVELPILATCRHGGTVLDPFAGSGTTLNYARKHGRLSIGIDISPEYCQLMQNNCEGHF